MKLSLWVLVACSSPAYADEVDVNAFEYVDVIETFDGSILRGVIVEQDPRVNYKLVAADGNVHIIQLTNVAKLRKMRNRYYRLGARVHEHIGVGTAESADVRAPSHGLPEPLITPGMRADFDLAVEFPTGDITILDASFAPTFRIGYEQLFSNLGITGGVFARYSHWQIPGQTRDVLWTLETHCYAQAALHVGRVAPYLSATLGTDLNHAYDARYDFTKTTLGFGTNLQLGVKVAATPALTFGVGGDYHPGTDSTWLRTEKGTDASIEYFAIRVGAHVTL